MGKKPSKRPQPPSTDRLRNWVREGAFQSPAGLRLEGAAEAGGKLVVSFKLPDTDWREVLTPTEAEIAREVLAGLSNAEIARKRGTALRTIANQVASIYRKLQVRSRLELSLYALAGNNTFEGSEN